RLAEREAIRGATDSADLVNGLEDRQQVQIKAAQVEHSSAVLAGDADPSAACIRREDAQPLSVGVRRHRSPERVVTRISACGPPERLAAQAVLFRLSSEHENV